MGGMLSAFCSFQEYVERHKPECDCSTQNPSRPRHAPGCPAGVAFAEWKATGVAMHEATRNHPDPEILLRDQEVRAWHALGVSRVYG